MSNFANLDLYDKEQDERNKFIVSKMENKAYTDKMLSTFLKSGTTICGCVTADAVVIGADTRATAGTIVADKNTDKLHKLATNIFCGGAGTAADLVHVCNLITNDLELHRLTVGSDKVRVVTAVRRFSNLLFKYQGHLGCALVLGGVDPVGGPQLHQIYPHGSTDRLPFATMGSGSLAAMSVMETQYRDNMTIDQGIELCRQSIRAGVINDLGSGGFVDVCVIDKSGSHRVLRNYDQPCPRVYRNPNPVVFPKGTTPVLASEIEAMIDGVEVL